MKSALLDIGVAAARLVLAIRDAEKQGAEGVTYAWLAQALTVDRKFVKRTAHRAARAELVTIETNGKGAGAKAKLNLTAKGRAASEE